MHPNVSNLISAQNDALQNCGIARQDHYSKEQLQVSGDSGSSVCDEMIPIVLSKNRHVKMLIRLKLPIMFFEQNKLQTKNTA